MWDWLTPGSLVVQVTMRVMTPKVGFDEGADAVEWQHW